MDANAYDVPEVSIMARMKRIMISKHGYDATDFDECGFADVESMFLDDCREVDFRPSV